ncbi:Uncharacterised protein [Mycobacteroides abscessus subsp. abscessus]|nr:Uncharacterised protein [Mycobacteroides abscessus subsp. abscessus]
MTGVLPSVNCPIEMNLTSWLIGGMIIFSTCVGLASLPSMRGTEWP